MNKILETTKYVIDNSEHVKIDKNSIAEFCKTFHHGNIQHWLNVAPFNFPGLNDSKKLHFLVVLNSLSFSYWGDPKWTVEYKGEEYDGSYGMILALKRAVEEKKPILNFKYLSNIKEKGLKNILRANTEIPLLKERWKILKEIGRILTKKFDGDFSNMVKDAKRDAIKLLELIVYNFPSFNDAETYKGKKIYFYKRAQLLVSDISNILKENLKNVNKLTACADYKLPQMLRRISVLIYSKKLAEKVDNRIPILKESDEEIEIRANTIWAVEFMKDEIKKKDFSITSQGISDHLWLLSQDKFPTDKPYHLTRTIFY